MLSLLTGGQTEAEKGHVDEQRSPGPTQFHDVKVTGYGSQTLIQAGVGVGGWRQVVGLGSARNLGLVPRASPIMPLSQGLKFKAHSPADMGLWPRLVTIPQNVSWSPKILVQCPRRTLGVGNRRMSGHCPQP